MYFTSNKRLKRKKGKETLRQSSQDIFSENVPTETTVTEVFRTDRGLDSLQRRLKEHHMQEGQQENQSGAAKENKRVLHWRGACLQDLLQDEEAGL